MSARIATQFCQSRFFYRNRAFGIYIAAGAEVETADIIQRCFKAGKQVFVPVVRARGRMEFVRLTRKTPLRKNRYGIFEPISEPKKAQPRLDVVVVPMLAFDDEGHRIGAGGGYYDRYFRKLRLRQKFLRPKLIGLAFNCQQVPEIAQNPWDIAVCDVITEIS